MNVIEEKQSQRRLHLGSIELDFPVVQAALSGYSDWPMRVMARRLGAPYTVCEVMLNHFVTTVRRKSEQFLKVSDEEHPVGAQLMGAEPEQFGPAAQRLVECGFDVIDINFGCPVKKVLGRCRGGFHLSQPETALQIIAAVRDAVPERVPVTVKMRRGIDDSPESEERFFEIFDGAWERGVSAITVHGRTVLQRYNGPSSWEALRAIKQHAGDKTVLGSGDLFSAQDCLDMMSFTGVDGVTVARGSIGNPWIFPQARTLARGELLPPPPTVFEQRDVLQQHFALAREIYGDKRCAAQMRKFGIKYARSHPDTTAVRDAFVVTKCVDDWSDVLRTHYSHDAPGIRPQLVE